jgi:hypothetical protein
MRLILRLVVVALAAVGVKTLYDKFARRSDEFKERGAELLDRTGSAAHDIGATASDAAQNVAAAARSSANDVKQAASDNADAVRKAAFGLKDASAQ